MEIDKGMRIYDLSLYLVKSKTLIIADMHLGYEEALNKRGVLIPRIQFKDTYERLEKILSKLEIETFVVTGDFKHEFGVISETEWRNLLQMIDLILKYAKRLVVIKGNHDVALGPVARKRNIELLDYYKVEDMIICHGDEILGNEEFNSASIIIMGHEHPAIGLKEGTKYENYKCFLKGKWKNKELIVIPSFNILTIGTDVLRGRLLSPFLQQDLSKFEVFIVEQCNVYNFGKIKNLQ